MAEKNISPGLKTALDLGPVFAFFAGYVWLRDETFTIFGIDYSGFIAVTAAFIPLAAFTTWLLYRLTGKVPRMQLITLILIVVFGGLTIWLNDERFFKTKPTAVYGLFAAFLGFGLLRNKSYLQFALGDTVPLSTEGWNILTRRLVGFFAGLAALNELVWRNMSTDAWVNFKTFGLTALVFVFMLSQYRLLHAHALDRKKDGT